ncbi:hypothetical protein [Hyphococcus lacteus]|uniref:Uncharacterized protein n=1 Tax=Hyphococcus lacteus TaxID=3143536 RepID=A0ABV3Z1N5_9PROT
MSKILLFGVVLSACFGFAMFRMQPKPMSAIEAMTTEQRLAYFQSRETSDIVGYYCSGMKMSAQVERDLEQSLRRHHGVTQCSSANGNVRRIPSE